MYKLYSIFYNTGDWGGHQTICYIAKSVDEVKANCKFYNEHKHLADRSLGGTADLIIHEVTNYKYIDYIENGEDFNLIFEKKEGL